MKEEYTGMRAVKIEVGREHIVTISCMEVTALENAGVTGICINPDETTGNMWFGLNPYGE